MWVPWTPRNPHRAGSVGYGDSVNHAPALCGFRGVLGTHTFLEFHFRGFDVLPGAGRQSEVLSVLRVSETCVLVLLHLAERERGARHLQHTLSPHTTHHTLLLLLTQDYHTTILLSRQRAR